MKMHQLFPRAIAHGQIPNGIKQEEVDFVRGLDWRGANPAKRKFNVISKEQQLLQKPEMKRIHDYGMNMLTSYYHEILGAPDTVKPKIINSWANLTMQGTFHGQHTHHNSLVSGVIYINVEDDDCLTFHDMRYKGMEFVIPEERRNVFNAREVNLMMEQGDVIVFDSDMHHAVPYVKTNHERLSIAFNSFPVGVWGQDASHITLE